MSGQRQKQGLWLDPRTKLFLILIWCGIKKVDSLFSRIS